MPLNGNPSSNKISCSLRHHYLICTRNRVYVQDCDLKGNRLKQFPTVLTTLSSLTKLSVEENELVRAFFYTLSAETLQMLLLIAHPALQHGLVLHVFHPSLLSHRSNAFQTTLNKS